MTEITGEDASAIYWRTGTTIFPAEDGNPIYAYITLQADTASTNLDVNEGDTKQVTVSGLDGSNTYGITSQTFEVKYASSGGKPH